MKKNAVILGILLIALILWQQNHSNKTIKPIVNKVKPHIETTLNSGADLPNKKQSSTNTQAQFEEITNLSTHQNRNSQAGSYTKLYQDYALAKFCQKASRYDYPLLQINMDNVEPKDYFYNIEDNINANEQQFEIWATLFQDCEQLAIDYQQGESVIDEITILLLSTKAKTNKEISLKQAFLMVVDYQQTLLAIDKKAGVSHLEEIQQLEIKIKEIEQEIYAVVGDDSKEELYFALEKSLSQNESLLKEYIKANQNYYNSLLNEYINTHKQMLAMLKNSEGYTFELILNTLNQDRQIEKKYNNEVWDNDLLQIDVFDDIVGKYSNNSGYYAILAQPVINLFSCYKGVDCSIDSHLSISYCLGVGIIDRYPQACKKDLQSFLYDDYLSLNQLQDVKLIFNQLVSDYD